MYNKAFLSISSDSKNVGLARLAAATFASNLEFTLSELEEIKVAVSEAVTNCIIHGYPENNGKIDIEMIIKDHKLIIIIKDYGIGIEDIEAVLQPSYSTKKEHMGLGLAFIDSFMDDFSLTSKEESGTKIKMTKVPESKQKVVK
ncbi:MAG: anti-sigma F factor [Halanaerobiales bacterium]